MYDTTKIIAVLSDTVFFDDPPQKFISGNYYYKITALDNTLHQSAPSEEAHINITGIPEAPPIVVEHYSLLQNYPNPFNPSTKISWQSPVGSHQTLKVFDVLGNEVATLVDEYRNAGSYEINFNANSLSSGIYFYKLTIGSFVDSKKMILLR